jgi:hypothetical protein
MKAIRFAFASVACLVAAAAWGEPPQNAKAPSPPNPKIVTPPITKDTAPCLVGTAKCADIWGPPRVCLVGTNTCPTDARTVEVSK